MANDVSRASFSAKCKRALYRGLPEEDAEALPDVVGRIELCLYGTRDAAKGWWDALSEQLISIGFS